MAGHRVGGPRLVLPRVSVGHRGVERGGPGAQQGHRAGDEVAAGQLFHDDDYGMSKFLGQAACRTGAPGRLLESPSGGERRGGLRVDGDGAPCRARGPRRWRTCSGARRRPMGRRPRSCTSRTASGARPPTHSSPSRHARSAWAWSTSASSPTSASRSWPTPVPSGRWPTSASPPPGPPRWRCTRRARRSSAATCSSTPRRWRSSSRTPSSSRRSAGCASTCRLCARWWSWRPWDRWRTPWRGGAAWRGRTRDPAELEARIAAITPDDVFVLVYTSGTTGPAKGCLLTHANYRSVVSQIERHGVIDKPETVFLYLPSPTPSPSPSSSSRSTWGRPSPTGSATATGSWPTSRRSAPPTSRPFPECSRRFTRSPGRAPARAAALGRACSSGRSGGPRGGGREREGRALGRLLRARHALADRLVLTRAGALRRASVAGDHRRRAHRGRGARVLRRVRGPRDGGLRPLRDLRCRLPTPPPTTASAPWAGCCPTWRRFAEDGELLVRGPNVFGGYLRDPLATARRSTAPGCARATWAASTPRGTSSSRGARRT